MKQRSRESSGEQICSMSVKLQTTGIYRASLVT